MDVYKFVGTKITKGVWQEQSLVVGHNYSIGDFERYNGEVTEAIEDSLFLLPDLFSGSDFSGGLLERSNHRAFLKQFGKVEGVYEVWGGYGTFGVAIRLDVSINNREIKELLDSLEDYAIIDEEIYRTIEHEWDSTAMKDIVSDLCRSIDLEKYIQDYETLLENEEKIEKYAWEAIDKLNLNFIHENKSSYIDNGKIQTYVEDMLLIEHCMKLPLLINREWACEDNKQKFNNKFSTYKEALT